MQSIVTYTGVDQSQIETLRRAIEATTRGKVFAVISTDDDVRFYLVHHEGPTCPHCGRKIHEYGHGLCIMCWVAMNPAWGL